VFQRERTAGPEGGGGAKVEGGGGHRGDVIRPTVTGRYMLSGTEGISQLLYNHELQHFIELFFNTNHPVIDYEGFHF